MVTKRILLKLSQATNQPPLGAAGLGVGAAARMELTPLFDVPASAGTNLAFGEDGSRQHRWYATEISSGPALERGGDVNDWDLAHNLISQPLGFEADARLLALEPDIEQQWIPEPPGAKGPLPLAAAPCRSERQKGDPYAEGPGFGWHLTSNFSELKEGRDAVMGSGEEVVVAHLDSGFDPRQKVLPENLDRSREHNFVDADRPGDATDRAPASGVLVNRGHGTATLGILAGGRLTGVQPEEANTGDFLGGAPLARVVPVRIANSVVHLWTSTVAQGIAYARQIGADVISMSMGGLPSSAWADAVNAAYDAGIVIVCAAGNNFGGFPMTEIVWPARFRRVIAACGIMADGRPYFNMPATTMQGNYGPPSKMATAMAAFTPNVPWPKIDCVNVLDLDGGGTSAATPQIAAAAALWLRKYKAEMATKYAEPWMRVEATRRALFDSAKGAVFDATGSKKPHAFFGEGILKANAALAIGPAELSVRDRQPLDRGPFSFFGLPADLGVDGDPRRVDLLQLELTQLAVTSKATREIVPDTGLEHGQVPSADRRRLLESILDEGRCSQALRRHLEAQLGRSSTRTDRGAPTPTPGAYGKQPGKPATAAASTSMPGGTELPRQTRRRPPAFRRLQIYAVDPSFSNQLSTSFMNKAVVEVAWESTASNGNLLQPGPVGEYLEVVDVDPASNAVYDPVDLNDPFLLAQNGLAPSEANPQFHQQMAYAVAMRTIDSFEAALGRRVLWAAKYNKTSSVDPATGQPTTHKEDFYVPRLRIYPHALRQANAYYSPDKVALLFGYFPEQLPDGGADRLGGMVFTCLSQDIVAHETTHAVLDGLHRRYQEASNVDVLAFHEAFADIVAIFQHFTLPEVLRFEIARTRGALQSGGILAELARQFGEALGRSKALRSAIGVDPAHINYASTTEPHERGSILVAAVFAAFLAIYQRRSDDLIRLATGGSGVLAPGAIHPDLIARLADEAAKTARHVLQICIRALDYCPPLDITFMDYLRALITADADLVDVDRYGYRVAFLEAFRARGIYPYDIRTLSVESLQWGSPAAPTPGLAEVLKRMNIAWARGDRREIYVRSKENAAILHGWLAETNLDGSLKNLDENLAVHFGLNRFPGGGEQPDGFKMDERSGRPRFKVHSVRPARRVSPDGEIKTDIIVVIIQKRKVPDGLGGTFTFRGGCTLVIDPAKPENPIRYCVVKSIWSTRRLEAQRSFRTEAGGLSLHSLYFGDRSTGSAEEPFALLHIGQ